jgi:drug/metabolite transporter (DMT)-like permease
VLIPILLPLFKLGKPHRLEWLGILGCLAGLYFLTGANFKHMNIGVFITLISSLATALSIVLLQKKSSLIPLQHVKLLTFYQIFFAIMIPGSIGAFHHSLHLVVNMTVVMGLLYCALLSTCITLFLQTKFQRDTTPTKTGIIFTMEPVFATLFAVSFNSEPLTRSVLIGGAIIIISLLITELKTFDRA